MPVTTVETGAYYLDQPRSVVAECISIATAKPCTTGSERDTDGEATRTGTQSSAVAAAWSCHGAPQPERAHQCLPCWEIFCRTAVAVPARNEADVFSKIKLIYQQVGNENCIRRAASGRLPPGGSSCAARVGMAESATLSPGWRPAIAVNNRRRLCERTTPVVRAAVGYALWPEWPRPVAALRVGIQLADERYASPLAVHQPDAVVLGGANNGLRSPQQRRPSPRCYT